MRPEKAVSGPGPGAPNTACSRASADCSTSAAVVGLTPSVLTCSDVDFVELMPFKQRYEKLKRVIHICNKTLPCVPSKRSRVQFQKTHVSHKTLALERFPVQEGTKRAHSCARTIHHLAMKYTVRRKIRKHRHGFRYARSSTMMGDTLTCVST